MPDVWTERLWPAGRSTTLEERENPREQNAQQRRRPSPVLPAKRQDAEEAGDEPTHQFGRMA